MAPNRVLRIKRYTGSARVRAVQSSTRLCLLGLTGRLRQPFTLMPIPFPVWIVLIELHELADLGALMCVEIDLLSPLESPSTMACIS